MRDRGAQGNFLIRVKTNTVFTGLTFVSENKEGQDPPGDKTQRMCNSGIKYLLEEGTIRFAKREPTKTFFKFIQSYILKLR